MVTWQLTIDSNDPERQVRFWAPVLGYDVQPPPEGHATWNDYYLSVGVPAEELDLTGDGTDRIFDPTGAGPKIWFQYVPEHKVVKNRLHLDVYVADRNRPHEDRVTAVEAKVAELVDRGATVARRDDSPGHYFVVMQDPDGNEFCVA